MNKLMVPIFEISLWEKNPREISDNDFRSLKRKIARWGLWRPFLVWKSKKQIIGGNQRYKAVKELGHKEIWVEFREPKNEAEALEMAITDNESSGEWIKSILIEQIKLNQEAINLDEYKINIKDSLLRDIMPVDTEEDNPPDEKDINTISVLGDLYELNEHRVLCGDSTNIHNVEKLMNGRKADMVFTDPPYGISIVKNNKVGEDFGMAKKGNYAEVIGDNTNEVAKAFYNTCIELKLDKFVIWGGNYFTQFLPFNIGWFIWDKRGDSGIKNTFADGEMAYTNIQKQVRIYTQLWNGMIRKGESGKRVHPTQKPIMTMGNIITDYTNKSACLLDGFLGSGSTLIACEKTERICYGMEIDPHYVDVIVARYIKFMQDQGKPFTIKRNGELINPNIFIKT